MSEETKDELKSLITSIESVESTTTKTGKARFKIKAGGLNFGLWKIKKDGTDTKAYQFLSTLGLDATGEVVEIVYKEDPGEFDGKAIIYRTIVMMERPSAADALMAQPMEREEQTYQKEGSLESQISKLEMRVLALECKDTPEAPENTSKVANIASEEVNSGSPDTTYKGKDGEDIVIPF